MSPPSPPGPHEAEAFAILKRLVIARTGHAYYADKDAALWERLRGRILASRTVDAGGYLALLRRAGEESEAEWAALEAAITIGETFFFRDTPQFVALRDAILPGLIARRREQRRLRIWSAGCSTGAEPYSVSILLRRLLGEAHRDWSITILGTDLSEAALRAAREARFSPWALRGMAAGERDRDFEPAEEGRLWQLRPEHRGSVRFERQNLLWLLENRMPLGMVDFDLILCRNVLIYFDRATVPDLVRGLAARLAPEGWLLLGHAEPDPTFGAFLRPVSLAGTTAWRTLGSEGPAPEAAPWEPLLPPHPVPPVPEPAMRPAPPRPAIRPAPPPGEADGAAAGAPGTVLARARAEADAGEYLAARESLRDAVRLHPTEAAPHHLDGLVARALGDGAAAEAALRRALYLDGGFVAAHYHLGLLLLERGAAEEARRSLSNAARLARGLPGETVLAEADGMTAATLIGLTRLSTASAPMGRRGVA